MANEVKEVTLVVGAGGTGSYFIKNLVHYCNTLSSTVDQNILVIDGDIVEEKNLLRQGFYRNDLGFPKATTIIDRLKPITSDHVNIHAELTFLSTAQQIVDMLCSGIYANAENYTIVSCVDNNMARLRMMIGMYLLHEATGKEVRFVDSGNTEWTGQTLASVLKARKHTYLKGLYSAILNGYDTVQNFEIQRNDSNNILYNQFTTNPDWINNLTKGDHELSCDDVTASNPQNVATNMTASSVLLTMYDRVQRKNHKGGEYIFDAKKNTFQLKNNGQAEETGYKERLVEILDYLKSPVGYREVFGMLPMANTTNSTEKPFVEQVEAIEDTTTNELEANALKVEEIIVENTVSEQENDVEESEEINLPNPTEDLNSIELDNLDSAIAFEDESIFEEWINKVVTKQVNKEKDMDKIDVDFLDELDDFLD